VGEQKQQPSLPAKELAQAVNPTVDPRQRQLDRTHPHQSKLPAHIVFTRAFPNAGHSSEDGRAPALRPVAASVAYLQVIDISVRVAQYG
jgi:hypothetical protein